MPRKNTAFDEKERGSSSTLEVVKYFLQNDTIPENYSKNNKRALRRRAKQFVLIKDELYFTGGRSRHNRSLLEGVKDEAENPENEPDHTQVLRKVLFSEEEQQKAVDEAHVGEDGHYGMEKTTERVSNLYYWMGITFTVRNTIHSCLNCSSRSKTSTLYKINTSFPSSSTNASTTGSATKNPAGMVNIMTTSAHDMAGKAGSGSADDDGDLGDLGDFNEDLGEKDEVISATHPVSSSVIKQQTYVPKDVCSNFWQKVEIQVFGPYEAGKKSVYVVVALDTYSQFPEATCVEVLTAATLSHFILSLFCRYGVMEKLLLLQNQVTKNKEYYLNKSLLEAGISPSLLFPQASLLDKRWKRIENSLQEFIRGYPEFWFHCLEAFMVPLRITVPPEADYSPHYLSHGREPLIPETLSKVCDINMDGREIQLTEEQERRAVEVVTVAYGIHSDYPCIPSTVINTQPLSKHLRTAAEAHSTSERVPLERRKQSKTNIRQGTRKRLFGSGVGGGNTPIGIKTEDGGDENESGMDIDELPNEQFDHDSDIQDDSDTDVTYEPEVRSMVKKSHSDHTAKSDNHDQPATRTSTRERKITQKAQEANIFRKKERAPLGLSSKVIPDAETSKESDVTLPKARVKLFTPSKRQDAATKMTPRRETLKSTGIKAGRGRLHKNSAKEDHRTKAFTLVKRKSDVSVNQGAQHVEITNNLEKLPLDTFYFVLKQYKMHGVFPMGVSEDTRQFLHVCEVMQVKDGKLYSNIGKSAGRLVITTEKARIGVLRKAHVHGEEHYGRTHALKHLSDMNVFWKGMSLDLDAFIHACPECFVNNPLRNKSVVTVPSKAVSFTAEERQLAEEDHLSEDEEEECSYEDISQYLTDSTFPSSATLLQRLAIGQQSAMFRFIKGTLYYLSSNAMSPDADPCVSMPELRQVLMSEASRFKAVCEAHVEDSIHLSPQETQARLRQKYFWSGMTFDIMAQVMGCCMTDALTAVATVPHRNPVIQARVTKLLKYYSDMMIPKLDTSLLTGSGSGIEVNQHKQLETIGLGGVQEISLNGDGVEPTRSTNNQAVLEAQVNVEVAKAVDAIIVETGKSVAGEDKTTDYGWSNDGKVDMVGQTSVANLRKDAHKCQYCGKFISGNVAFRVHLYKHTGVKPYSCQTCGKSFTTSKSLQVHTRKHTGIKPYLCNRCGREFFRSTSFKYHLKTHNRIKGKPLPCDQCSREFRTQNRLDKHKEFKHPAEPKIYMCKHCGKVFTTARSLKWHEQSHTNPRKYQCPVCFKDFARKDYAEAHTRATHSMEELEACGHSHDHIIVTADTTDKQQEHLSASQQAPPQPHPQDEQQAETTVELQEHQIQQFLPHFLNHAVVTSEGQHDQQQQQQGIQLLHDVNIPTTSNISVIQWTQDEEDERHHQPTPSIIIDNHHLHQLQQHHQASTATHITLTSEDAGEDPTVITEHQMVVTSSDLDVAFQAQHAHNRHHHPQHHTITQPTTTVHILAPAQLPSLPPDASTLTAHPHHHNIPHLPAASSTSTTTASTAVVVTSSQLQALHTLQQQAQPTVVLATSGGNVLLKQEAVPVQYEVECMSSGGDTTTATSGLTAADLHAVELLAHASLGGQNILQ